MNSKRTPTALVEVRLLSLPGRRGGAPRSESKITMIASGNHTIIYMPPPYVFRRRGGFHSSPTIRII